MATPSDDSPISQRRQLGAAMRSFRKDADMDRETAAALIELDGSTLSRKESGQNKFKRVEIETLAKVYGNISEDDLDELLDLAREARAGSKRGQFPSFVSVKGRAFIELERDSATEIMTVTLTTIPLYFQTDEWMRAAWEASGDIGTADRIDELTGLRKLRQQVVNKVGAPTIRVVIHEFALYLPVGGPDVMHRQLLSLAKDCERANVEIQVQPIEGGAYPDMDSTFTLLRFSNGPASDMVQVSSSGEMFYRNRANATEPYRVAFDRRKVAALDFRASRARILDAATHWEAKASS